MTARSAFRLVAAAALILVLAACDPARLPTDTVGAQHAVPVPVSVPTTPAPSPDPTPPPAPDPAPAPDPSTDVSACGTEVPPGASRAALAYVAALKAANPAWLAIDQKIHAAGDAIYFDDLSSQIDADTTFLEVLDGIAFPADAAPAAADLAAAVRAYDDFLTATLQAGEFGATYADTDLALLQARANSSSHLRDLLGLPQASCVLRRP